MSDYHPDFRNPPRRGDGVSPLGLLGAIVIIGGILFLLSVIGGGSGNDAPIGAPQTEQGAPSQGTAPAAD